MKTKDYRNAIEEFVPDPTLKGRIVEAVCYNANPVCKHRFTRVAAVAMAAVLLIVGSVGVAMAASPEFRFAVFSFLHIGEPEKVPGPNGSLDGAPNVHSAVIGDTVKAQYIQLDGSFNVAQDGLLCQTQIELDTEAVKPVNFWNIEGDTAVRADVKVNRSKIDIEFDGVEFKSIFYWYEHNGEISAFNPGRNLASGSQNVQAVVKTMPGKTDRVILELAFDGFCKYYGFDLNTSTTQNLFALTDAENIKGLKSAEFAKDMSCALLNTADGWLYLDFNTGNLRSLSELTGIGKFNLAYFLNDGSVQLLKWINIDELGAGKVDCWLYDHNTGATTKVLDEKREFNEFNKPCPYGVVILGSYCLDVAQSGQVSVINLKTGRSIALEGFTYNPEATLKISPDGTKILYAEYDDGAMMFVNRLGVINMADGKVIEFERINPAELFELNCFWPDNAHVAISGVSADGNTTSLYVYEF